MSGVFISDEEVETYEKKSDPARRSGLWSVAAVAAAFLFIAGSYAWGKWGSESSLTASLGETFPLWSAGRDSNESFARPTEAGPSVANVSTGVCGYESGGAPTRGAVFFSEVAWMGTEEGAQYEWVELANTGNEPVNIGGWSLVDKDEQIQFVFPKNASIPPSGFLLLARSADRVGNEKADFRYTGNLKNEDESLRLFNEKCEVMDEVLAAPKWPAGEGAERRTMERNLTTKTWYTSAKVGGTPKATNSTLTFSAAVSSTVTSTTTLTPASASGLATSSPTSVGAVAVAISEVMAGKDGAANWDFVELHNGSSDVVNLTGWRMTKKSSTGNETSLVAAERLKDIKILAGGYLLLAHPDYGGTVDVVWPKSYALAYTNNAVVLYNADGVKVDEILWTEIPKGQSYVRNGSVWVIGAPTPKAAP